MLQKRREILSILLTVATAYISATVSRLRVIARCDLYKSHLVCCLHTWHAYLTRYCMVRRYSLCKHMIRTFVCTSHKSHHAITCSDLFTHVCIICANNFFCIHIFCAYGTHFVHMIHILGTRYTHVHTNWIYQILRKWYTILRNCEYLHIVLFET